MDRNKRAKLEEIGYVIRPCCGLCCFGDFPDGRPFGSCCEHEYHHQKHKFPIRPLSIHRAGYCSRFLKSATQLSRLKRFSDFYKEEEE